MKVETGQHLDIPCDCGAHRFPAVVGDSLGYAEIREVDVDLGPLKGTERVRVAFFPDGRTLFIDYPDEFDDGD